MTSPTSFDLMLANYKSIASLKIGGLRPFSVFVGPNGCGKSNFFDALDFVGMVCRQGVNEALRVHGGAERIRSERLCAPGNEQFEFAVKPHGAEMNGRASTSEYRLRVHDLTTVPKLEEVIPRSGDEPIQRSVHPLADLLKSTTLYRIDARAAKDSDSPDADSSKLNATGSNLAAVLRRLEADSEAREIIDEWMELLVPGVQAVAAKRQRLDQGATVLFKERRTSKRFPAGMMSDGTIHALGLLVAVLGRHDRPSLTLFEEPERGLHPAAVAELVDFLREEAGPQRPIWITTHSESVVRRLRLEELVLVDKEAGRTWMKRADSGNLEDADMEGFGLEAAWLSNLFNAGVPW